MFRGIVSIILVVLVVLALISISQKPDLVRGTLSRFVERSDSPQVKAMGNSSGADKDSDQMRAQMVREFITDLHTEPKPEGETQDLAEVEVAADTIDSALESLDEEEKALESTRARLAPEELPKTGEKSNNKVDVARGKDGAVTIKSGNGVAIMKPDASVILDQGQPAQLVKPDEASSEETVVDLQEPALDEPPMEQVAELEVSTEEKGDDNLVEMDQNKQEGSSESTEVQVATIDDDSLQQELSEESELEQQVAEVLVEDDVEAIEPTSEAKAMMRADAFKKQPQTPAQKKKQEIVQSLKTAPKYTLEAATSTIEPSQARVFFGFNDFTLSQSAQDVLASLAVQLLNDEAIHIRIVGNTDALGSAEANHLVSKKRAKVVADTLQSLGVESDRISTSAIAYNKPLRSNDDWKGRQLNRRVDIFIGN